MNSVQTVAADPNAELKVGSRIRRRWNSFQKTMLQWDELHPYNAVHVARVPAAFDLERLRRGINQVLAECGVSRASFQPCRCRRRLQLRLVPCQIEMITGGSGPWPWFGHAIERQLNTGFVQDESLNPFRFFAAPESESFWLGLVYFHAVADAESIVQLMQALLAAYLESPFLPKSLNFDDQRRAGLFSFHPMRLARGLWNLPAQLQELRRSSRPDYRDPGDFQNAFTFLRLNSAELSCLTEAGRSLGVTLHDLFLAVLMKSITPLAAPRTRAGRRRNVSIGSIVNIRKDLKIDGGRTFGLFLGSFVVSHEIPDGIGVRELATAIRRQTQRIKSGKLYLAAPLHLAFARFVLGFFSTERRKRFYQKHYPLWGGITNMNLNSRRDPQGAEMPLDYFRAVSTGPATPLVLSITTAGDRVNIGITYRTTVFAAEAIEGLKQEFVRQIAQLKAET